MLFFRDEEQVVRWCAANQVPRRPVVTFEQLWQLAVEWYGNRLTDDARRPGPAEMREIFARIGLTGDFWDPESDNF